MANSKKRRKLVIFTIIAVVLVGLVLAAVFRKRDDAISVQTDKVKRRDLTELVVANGRIQPVLQVKISPEVSGEIIELPVKEGQVVTGLLPGGAQPGGGQLQVRAFQQDDFGGKPRQGRGRVQTQRGAVQEQPHLRIRLHGNEDRVRDREGATGQRVAPD
jgi:hypothetical protein